MHTYIYMYTYMYISESVFTYKCFLMTSKQFEDVFKSLPEFPIHWICPHLLNIIEMNCAINEGGAGTGAFFFF